MVQIGEAGSEGRFEAAYARECRAIRAVGTQMLEGKDDPRQIWRINDYFSEERRETDRK